MRGLGGLELVIFYKESQSKKNICFFFSGRGGGTRVSGFLTFNTESKSKKKKKNIFFVRGWGAGARVSDFVFFFWGGGGSGGMGRWTDRRTGLSCFLLRIQI